MSYKSTNKNNNGFEDPILKNATDLLIYFFVLVKNLFIYGGYLPALWGPSLVLAVSLTFNTPVDPRILGISFLLPLVVYSHDYHKDLEKDEESNPERTAFLNKKWSLPLTISYLAILAGLLIWVSNLWIIILVVALFITGLMYSTVLKRITKKVPAFKNFYLGGIWSSWGTLLVVLDQSLTLNLGLMLMFLFLFSKVLINTIFFDLKDAKSDKKEGFKTLPAYWGVKPTIRFLNIINALAIPLLILGTYFQLLPLISLTLVPFSLYTWYYLKIGSKKDIKLSNKSFIADIEAICYPVALLLVNIIF